MGLPCRVMVWSDGSTASLSTSDNLQIRFPWRYNKRNSLSWVRTWRKERENDIWGPLIYIICSYTQFVLLDSGGKVRTGSMCWISLKERSSQARHVGSANRAEIVSVSPEKSEMKLLLSLSVRLRNFCSESRFSGRAPGLGTTQRMSEKEGMEREKKKSFLCIHFYWEI